VKELTGGKRRGKRSGDNEQTGLNHKKKGKRAKERGRGPKKRRGKSGSRGWLRTSWRSGDGCKRRGRRNSASLEKQSIARRPRQKAESCKKRDEGG